MELINYLISILFIGILVQFGEFWIVAGATLILVVSSKEVKTGLFMIFSAFALYYVNGIGMNDYWIFAMVILVAMGYLLGIGKGEEQGAGASPYGDLLGGMGGF
jgi:hypothetical protein